MIRGRALSFDELFEGECTMVQDNSVTPFIEHLVRNITREARYGSRAIAPPNEPIRFLSRRKQIFVDAQKHQDQLAVQGSLKSPEESSIALLCFIHSLPGYREAKKPQN